LVIGKISNYSHNYSHVSISQVTKQIGLKSTASEWYEASYNRAAFSSVDNPVCQQQLHHYRSHQTNELSTSYVSI